MKNEINVPTGVRQPVKIREYMERFPLDVVDENGSVAPLNVAPQSYLGDSRRVQYTHTLRIRSSDGRPVRFNITPDMESIGVNRVGASDNFLSYMSIEYLLLDTSAYPLLD